METPVKLLIVDDHPVFRRGLRDIIEESPQFLIIGEAADGDVALKLVAELRPDIAVVDIDMPRLNGLELMHRLQKSKLAPAVVFLTMYKEEKMFNAAMDLGVKAYVLKENAVDDILDALESIARGQGFISPSMTQISDRRSDRVQQLLLSKPQIDELTPAERRVLRLIAEDLVSKEIAAHLQVSVKTVVNQRHSICTKLKLHGSHSLLKFAFEHKSHL